MLALYTLRQNGIKRTQSVLSSPKSPPMLKMIQTRRSSALNGVDADDKLDRSEPPSKKVKVTKDSGTPESRFITVITNLLSILCKTHH